MDITFTIDSKDTELIERITRIIDRRDSEIEMAKIERLDGCCSTCPYWTSANETRSRSHVVKFGFCKAYDDVAINYDHPQCEYGKGVSYEAV